MNVVFDFGAVLFTWRPVEMVAKWFPERADSLAAAGHLAHEMFGHADWLAFDRGTVSLPEVIDLMAARLSLDRPKLATLIEPMDLFLEPMPESVAMLARLVALRERAAQSDEPLKLYFLSNMPAPFARTLERLHGFLGDFDGGIFSGDVKLIKPEPAIFELLQSRHALEPAKTVFIDDLLGNVQAAQAQGWHGIHFKSTAQVEQDLKALGLDF
ncbi:HAD family hydrolase [Variovorax sp. HJSM1_2]|uniref:HAD family hydrolase n=1 Tax=Variovorax sp. HJSM1_2 TaxID=3366263 RepID=UPI003BD4BDDC